jgi:hypothetical protein
VEDRHYRSELPRPPSVFGRIPRRVTESRLPYEESEESDDSSASTETVGYRVSYQKIARYTPLPPESEDGETTDTASVGTDRIAQEYCGELEQPIWD